MNEKYVVNYLDKNGNLRTTDLVGTWQDLKDFIFNNNYILVSWDLK